MIKNIAVMLCIGCGLTVAPSAQQAEHFLDLAAVPSADGVLVSPEAGQVPIDERLGPGSHPVISHGQAPQSPFSLRVTLLSLDPLSFAARDPLVYEVRLTNTGRTPISFPWSVDHSLFRASATNSSVLYVALSGFRETRRLGETGLVVLYGSTDVPGSVETIRPGESARIRVRSDWMIFAAGSGLVRVVVHPTYNGIGYPSIVSDNALAVQVLGKRP
jgi:hypothetical protein